MATPSTFLSNTKGVICTLQKGLTYNLCGFAHARAKLQPSHDLNFEEKLGRQHTGKCSYTKVLLALTPSFQLAFSLLLSGGWQRFRLSIQVQ